MIWVLVGDNPPHALWAETAESQLAASRWVASAMDRILGDYQVLPNIGNHGKNRLSFSSLFLHYFLRFESLN